MNWKDFLIMAMPGRYKRFVSHSVGRNENPGTSRATKSERADDNSWYHILDFGMDLCKL